MNPPALSICVPAYNAARFLPAMLASVRAQTFTDWELIVVEDGTHDEAEAMVGRFARQGRQPVTFIRHEKNQGLPATRNTGIALARGEWIALLDDDDLWKPDHLSSLLACARANPTADLVHSGSVLFDSDTGRELGVRAPSPAAIAAFPQSLFLGTYCVQPSSAMLRKSLWSRVGGFNAAFRYAEDREMWMRCAQAGAIFAYSGRSTCRYRKHATSLSTKAAPMALACALIFDQAAGWDRIPRPLRISHAAEAWISAGRIILRSDPATARAYFDRARHYRSTPRVLAYGAAATGLNFLQRLRPAASTPPVPAHD